MDPEKFVGKKLFVKVRTTKAGDYSVVDAAAKDKGQLRGRS